MFWGIPSWAIGVGVIILAGSIGRAIMAISGVPPKRQRLGRRGLTTIGVHIPDDTNSGEVASGSAEALEDMQRRVAELEERMDFAERLLAKQRDGERLGPPRS